MYICPCHSLTSSQLTLPSPHVLKSILYVCIFIPVLPLGSSEPFFFRFHIYVLAYGIYFSLSDLLHSVWTVSRSIHLTTNNSISFLFYGWVIFHCIYVPHLLYGISLCFNLPFVLSTCEGNKTKCLGNDFLSPGSGVGWRGTCSNLFPACIQWCIGVGLHQLMTTSCAHRFPTPSLCSVTSSCTVIGSLKLAMVGVFIP